jgi:glutamate-ammonia-ligase adenylyltransferase
MRKTPEATRFPQPADPQAARHLREDFAALGEAQAAFAHSAPGVAVLDALGGNAPYLAELALRESACLLAALAQGPEKCFAAALDDLHALAPDTTRREIASALRRAKRRAALTIALADLAGLWPLPRITAALSDLAETTLRVAVSHLLRSLHGAGQITLSYPETPERNCGFVALALGKLGARELNYSSDIDLVLLFDPENSVYPPDAQAMMARFARDLVALLANRDAEGYVFRVDLRLRPDPGATPPVVALPTALTYYESHGRTWERAAFSKARPVAGDLALGAFFLAAIRPFIWRKNLDFAAIADIHDMKRQIDAQHGKDGLLGRDVKLGRGGIREIEFIVQTLSLVWGGQEPALRIPATLTALPALAKAGHMPEAAARALAADYRRLRQVEHRLQMVADRQTHELPATDAALAHFAIFLNEKNFLRDFPRLLARVHRHFLAFFDAGNDTGQVPAIDPGTQGAPPDAFATHLKALGFTDIKHLAERLRAWSGGEMPALRSERARSLLDHILPHLLNVLSQQPDPDKAFALFDTLLSRQRAGVQLLSLFQRNPALLRRLAAVLGAAPALAEYLAQDAQALEALLVPNARFAAPKPMLRRLLHEARDLEDAVEITRHFVRREEFHLSVATLEGRRDANEAGLLRANLAEAALASLLPFVIAGHQARYGRIPRGALAVVALGKAGSGEMLAGSDLDLMLIYDHAAMPTAPTQYFVRLSHAFTGAITAQGVSGPLYKVDMRLRPSGNHGPVAVSLAAFRRYHETESWTWERLALTRARVLAATPGFAKIVQGEILKALSHEAAPDKIRQDTATMRERIEAELPPRGPFDVKNLPGGMLEVTFIAEALQLIHGPANPALFCPNTAASLRALITAGHLPPEDGETLIAADFLWRSIQGIERITGLRESITEPPPATLAPLLRATATADLAALRERVASTSRAVRSCFERYITPGVPA